MYHLLIYRGNVFLHLFFKLNNLSRQKLQKIAGKTNSNRRQYGKGWVDSAPQVVSLKAISVASQKQEAKVPVNAGKCCPGKLLDVLWGVVREA